MSVKSPIITAKLAFLSLFAKLFVCFSLEKKLLCAEKATLCYEVMKKDSRHLGVWKYSMIVDKFEINCYFRLFFMKKRAYFCNAFRKFPKGVNAKTCCERVFFESHSVGRSSAFSKAEGFVGLGRFAPKNAPTASASEFNVNIEPLRHIVPWRLSV